VFDKTDWESKSKTLSKDNKWALSNSVWSVKYAMLPWIKREKEAFLANIQNFLDWKTLQTLIDVKAEWATFWALSNEELKMLQNSASKLNQLSIRDKDTNRIKWFRWSEDNFKRLVGDIITDYEDRVERISPGKTNWLIKETKTEEQNLFDNY
jgi:hypothetical protein